MSKRYALETIAAAKELYLQGQSFRDVAREISSRTGRQASAALIFKWAEKGNKNFCNGCGIKLKDNDKFCSNCGEKVS